jgi:hypothetical protein
MELIDTNNNYFYDQNCRKRQLSLYTETRRAPLSHIKKD